MMDSVGARLRQAREQRHLTLQQVSEITKVRPHYLQALESDDHSAIPSAAQARGFLRIYADFLELEVADLVPPPQPVEPPPPAPLTGTADKPAPDNSRPNLWTSLRDRLVSRKTKEAAVAPVLPPAPEPPHEPVPLAPVADQPTTPPINDSPILSPDTKAKTTRRSKSAPRAAADSDGPAEIKKNVVS